MFSLKDLMLNEVKKSLEKSGVKANVDFLGNYLVITLTKQEVSNILLSGFPEQFKGAVEIEASDIKIKVKVI
ncbi:MAG: hypothetical protein QW734_07505 [Candidatus Bathyarchaeia archaeon]